MPQNDDRTRVVQAMQALVFATEQQRQAVASEAALTMTDLTALLHLCADGDLGQGELAARLGITSGSTTTLVDRLVHRELAERKHHPTDRRRAIVSITARGGELARTVDDAYRTAWQRVPAEALDTVATALTTVAAALAHPSTPGTEGAAGH